MSTSEPPTDPKMPVEPMGKYEWLDLILQLRIPPQRKAVAQALAWFARRDGSHVKPGQKKVADMANLHVSKAGPHIRALHAAGLLKLVKAGGGRAGDPHLYRLSRPADVSGLPLWLDPDMERYPAGGPVQEIQGPPRVGADGPATAPGAQEQEPPAVGADAEQRPSTVGVPERAAPVDNSEHRPPAVGETDGIQTADGPDSPVDNSEHRPLRAETQTASHRNNNRPRVTNTFRTPSEHVLGSPQVGTSLGRDGRTSDGEDASEASSGTGRTAPSLGALVLDRGVGFDVGIASLDAQLQLIDAKRSLRKCKDPDHWLNEARGRLTRPDYEPPLAAVMVVAAELYRRSVHHPNDKIMNGGS